MSTLNDLATISNLSEHRASIEDILIHLGVKEKHVVAAMNRQKVTGEPLPVVARDMGLVSAEKMAQAIAVNLGVEYLSDAEASVLDPVDMAKLRNLIGQFSGYVPVGYNHLGGIIIAISSREMINKARNALSQYNPTICIASDRTIQKVYRQFFARTAEAFDEVADQVKKLIRNHEDSGDFIQRMLCSLLRHSCYHNASDIYIWRTQRAGAIRIKIDGTGQIFRTLTLDVFERLMNTLVLNSGKADALRHEPQESRIDLPSESLRKEFDDVFSRFIFRMELVQDPVTGFRNAVIRLNDSESSEVDFGSLGFDDWSFKTLKGWSDAPTGLVLVTGPTGSGKTTSLYSLLKEIDPIERAIFSIERPVEFRHGSWIQHDLPRGHNEGEASRIMLKALLREAPDVILIGELRDDPELIKTALAAANTGHLVFATLHTNSAARAVMRLVEMGASHEALAAVIKGAMAQRLVGLLCPKCKMPDTRESTLKEFNLPYMDAIEKTPYMAVGCEHCDWLGMRGRKMVYELMDGEAVRDLIEAGRPVSEVERAGIREGYSLWASGLKLVAQGLISMEELVRRADRDSFAIKVK